MPRMFSGKLSADKHGVDGALTEIYHVDAVSTPCFPGLLRQRLHRNIQRYLIANNGSKLPGVELAAQDLARGVGADGVFFQHRVRAVEERGHRQDDGLGDALDGQVAFDGGRLVALEIDFGRLEGCRGEVGRIEEVGSLDMAVEGFEARIDGGHVDRHVDLGVFGFLVEHDRARRVFEAQDLLGHTHMIV